VRCSQQIAPPSPTGSEGKGRSIGLILNSQFSILNSPIPHGYVVDLGRSEIYRSRRDSHHRGFAAFTNGLATHAAVDEIETMQEFDNFVKTLDAEGVDRQAWVWERERAIVSP
jgi:hypothetical protein